MLRSFLSRRRQSSEPQGSVPAGRRVYAIGDIHGRLDLLDELLEQIDADHAARGPAAPTLIFLGDLIDRGPDSAGVVDRLLQLSGDRPDVRFLLGNHEEIFLASLAGDEKALRVFCRVGGRETAISYGIDEAEYERLSYEQLLARLREVVPDGHRRFLAEFQALITLGDYVFVHAGIRPGVPLAEQNERDLRWIRDSFLGHGERLEKVVVHGHTIEPEGSSNIHRIGIDTGAYQTGRLTALGLEGDSQWRLQT